METNNQILEVAKEILAINPTAYLSGSLALKLQGFEPRREPVDIDIYIDDISKFVYPHGMNADNSIETKEDDRYADDEDFIRDSNTYKGFKVDTFWNRHYSNNKSNSEKLVKWNAHGVRVIKAHDIVEFKLSHVFNSEHSSPESTTKHIDDIIHLLNQFKAKLPLL